MGTRKITAAICLKLQGVALLTFASAAFAQTETAADVVAAHVRSVGHSCEKVVSAEREKSDSRPNDQVWILTCSNATYRVQLVPDLAGKVEVLQPKK